MSIPALKYSRFLVILGIVSALALVGTAFQLMHRPGYPVAGIQPGLAIVDTAQPSLALSIWVAQALELNGLTGADSLYLHHSGKAWVADFRGLPLWNLPEEEHVIQMGVDYPDSIRIEGLSLCKDISPAVTAWLDRTTPGWKSTQRCSGADQQVILDAWLKEMAGKLVLVKEEKDAQGMVSRLHLVCKDAKSTFLWGRLLPLRDLKSLELDNCLLGDDQLLQHLPVNRLVLRGSRDEHLDVSLMKELDTLKVDGGTVSWLAISERCPIGRDSCPLEERLVPRDMRLSRIPMCDPELDSLLGSYGAVREFMRCQDFPREVALRAHSLEQELEDALTNVSEHAPEPKAKPLPERLLKLVAPKRGALWNGVEPGMTSCCSLCGGYQRVRAGREWIENPGIGTFYFGPEGMPSGRLPDFGTPYEEIRKALPVPFVENSRFLIWCAKEPYRTLQLILHLDESARLDAVWVPSGCWQEDWAERYQRRYQKLKDEESSEEGE